jgi:hypothetical protein
MHRKTQIFFTRQAARALMDRPGAANDLREQLLARAKATADPEAILQGEDPLTLDRPMLDQLRLNPPPGTEKALYYLTVGSKNQDPRSAFLDGETTFVVAGPWSLFGYSDFILLMAATTWVENDADLLRLIPIDPQESRRAARLIRKVL